MKLKKTYGQLLCATILTLYATNATAQRQPGMVDKPGGGQRFDAEQYKIDRMKSATSVNTSTGTGYNKSSSSSSRSYSSDYDPGAGFMTNPKEWSRVEHPLNYRKCAKKAKSKDTEGLDFEYPEEGVAVTHANDGIDAYHTKVFHNHPMDVNEYNNVLYDLYYSIPMANTDSFGFGVQFITGRSIFHECTEYTFYSFIITKGNNLYYLKKKLPSKATSGYFAELRSQMPDMFRLDRYSKVAITSEQKDKNLLTVLQWQNKMKVAINDVVVYEDGPSKCPVTFEWAPYNLFLNKGTVTFFEGSELYTEKKHF